MKSSESNNWVNQWVRSYQTPGLWSHPTGYWYFDKSQLMAFYDSSAKQWKMYDHLRKQWYEYSANVFFGQNMALTGTRQQVARETLYEPLPLFSEVTNTLVTKVWPMADRLRFIENADDKSAAKPIMENIFNEINDLSGKTFTDIGMPVAKFLGDVAVELVKLKDNVNAAHDFRIITEETIKTMERVAPAFETGIPAFYQVRVWPWLAAAAGALGAALLAMMYDNASFVRKHSWQVADCYDRNTGNWQKIEDCLLKDYKLAPEDARYCIFWLKHGLQFAIDKGWYTPKQRRENLRDPNMPMQPAAPIQPVQPQPSGYSQLGALTSYLQQLLPYLTQSTAQPGGGYYAPQVPIGINPSVELYQNQRLAYINLYNENNKKWHAFASQPIEFSTLTKEQQDNWIKTNMQYQDTSEIYKSLIRQVEHFLAQMGSPVPPYFGS